MVTNMGVASMITEDSFRGEEPGDEGARPQKAQMAKLSMIHRPIRSNQFQLNRLLIDGNTNNTNVVYWFTLLDQLLSHLLVCEMTKSNNFRQRENWHGERPRPIFRIVPSSHRREAGTYAGRGGARGVRGGTAARRGLGRSRLKEVLGLLCSHTANRLVCRDVFVDAHMVI